MFSAFKSSVLMTKESPEAPSQGKRLDGEERRRGKEKATYGEYLLRFYGPQIAQRGHHHDFDLLEVRNLDRHR